MRKLYSFKICPFSRKVRAVLAEKRLNFEISEQSYWLDKSEILKINPAGEVPVFVESNSFIMSDSLAIATYLDKVYRPNTLISDNPYLLAEIYRLNAWFDIKFYSEVTKPVIYEKLLKRLKSSDKNLQTDISPNSKVLYTALQKMTKHLKYLDFQLQEKNWLVSDEITLADITAAAHISCLDYLFAIDWKVVDQGVKEWYAKIKSRKSFEAILQDKLPIFNPPSHYKDPDFN